jgi:hypothetical protein
VHIWRVDHIPFIQKEDLMQIKNIADTDKASIKPHDILFGSSPLDTESTGEACVTKRALDVVRYFLGDAAY